jgi:CMP/dCMP kinase
MTRTIITIDGVAGSGKSTLARALAREMKFIHLNSGLLYRAVGVLADQQLVSLDNAQELLAIFGSYSFEYVLGTEQQTRFLIDGHDREKEFSTAEAGSLASKVSLQPVLREAVTQFQQDLGQKQSLVLEGRDAGTVVFPDATCKFFIDADLRLRAEWRLRGQSSDLQLTIEDHMKDISERDARDISRNVAPLKQAHDAERIINDGRPVEELVKMFIEKCAAKNIRS